MPAQPGQAHPNSAQLRPAQSRLCQAYPIPSQLSPAQLRLGSRRHWVRALRNRFSGPGPQLRHNFLTTTETREDPVAQTLFGEERLALR